MGTPWYLSKTLWTNALAFVAMVVQGQFGFVVTPAEQLGGLAVINLFLRLITNDPITNGPSAS